ncbi:MAG: hypothetical protein CMH48_07630 [Muricauda sp.]|nr:hypothetical protein [Allomuricauda sp.]MAU26953.1 hypothetical protein [Allomuricauda sp.]MBC30702.1 hypothetical protein [Allomuricauda sp.]|tara:strand:- start:505 stop:927 length:423 start_codon:yes stop_codon:yes gene_type:complete
MFSKSNLLATLVSGISMFVLGYVFWGMLGESLMEGHTLTNVMKEEPDFIHLFLGCLIGAFAFSTLYGKWARGHHSAKEGAEFGLWIGVFVGLGMGLIWFATSTMMDLTGHLMDAVINIIYYTIIGVIVALIYKATSAKNP